MARLGVSGNVIDECLNHVIESRVRRTYIRDRRVAEQARAFDRLGAHLMDLLRLGVERPLRPAGHPRAMTATCLDGYGPTSA